MSVENQSVIIPPGTPEYLIQVPKRKGRRPKSYYENLKLLEATDNSNNLIIYQDKKPEVVENTEPKVHKKRGRKPVGGKVVEVKNMLFTHIPIPNIILHLNCQLHDIEDNNISIKSETGINQIDNYDIKYEPTINQIDNYDIESNNKHSNLTYNFINEPGDKETNSENDTDAVTAGSGENDSDKILSSCDSIAYKKNIAKKLKELSYNLKHSNITNKSACFWCTCPFDNEPIYIPKHEVNGTVHCYGCFCSPECASSYLMHDDIDTSNKFERYSMLNNIYGKIYNYNKNIKPAPSPYYLLNKFYGNLDIQEYRKLLENERLLLIVNKPLSQVLPEIYEENEDFLITAQVVSKSSTINKTKPMKNKK
jgi:hypothetical protein|tara:strand:- start:4367 stop:5464 length:1098 start_codon:yes stop_codon:yes gene_type:complete